MKTVLPPTIIGYLITSIPALEFETIAIKEAHDVRQDLKF